MIQVYVASKMKYAKRFQKMRESWMKHGIKLHARWYDYGHLEKDDAPNAEFSISWLIDEHDVKHSHVAIIYGESDDELRGALVEAGIAIGAGILVIIVGDSPSFGTWQHHPKVLRAGSLEHAKNMILRLHSL
jgi:hypothetical protein